MQAINAATVATFSTLNNTYEICQTSGRILGIARKRTGYYVAVSPIELANVLGKSSCDHNSVLATDFDDEYLPHVEMTDKDERIPKLYFGIWNHDGGTYPEYSIRVMDLEIAKEIGRYWDQIAIWDIANKTEVPCKG